MYGGSSGHEKRERTNRPHSGSGHHKTKREDKRTRKKRRIDRRCGWSWAYLMMGKVYLHHHEAFSKGIKRGIGDPLHFNWRGQEL